MYFQVVVGYETEQVDRLGNPKMLKTKYIVEAESVEEATLRIAKYRSEDNRGSETLSINKIEIECVLDQYNAPELYNLK
jgi:hypothetical protein